MVALWADWLRRIARSRSPPVRETATSPSSRCSRGYVLCSDAALNKAARRAVRQACLVYEKLPGR
jgi:hypothetical protein